MKTNDGWKQVSWPAQFNQEVWAKEFGSGVLLHVANRNFGKPELCFIPCVTLRQMRRSKLYELIDPPESAEALEVGDDD